ncbi:tRNA lysidine(34) synthetase TilS [Rhizobium straminoryzae]|uniref:tRNA(Ile)-lysidine synthase n=1 Tax=Rhizobium straminoryzae TaxID=1387186 RepID=A0A549T610_9HYPH|nr:tRNA lysidine(34) synthetase TilS [Rhizobium straminoryzae]TRL37286.1 tRNA lysidine(34) synthetase TilS [Rhizobium straminoryzae]
MPPEGLAQAAGSSPLAAACDVLLRLPPSARLLVAVSGGSDSKGLLQAFHLGRQDAGRHDIHLFAATIDHGLRPEARQEAMAVAEWCAGLGIPHATRVWQGGKPATGISAAARAARYDLLATLADDVGADAILTGHTLDDQWETLAMRASRAGGEGGLGLAGMAPAVLLSGRYWLLRPFLGVRRQAIRSFLREAGLGWIDDPSNSDPRFERARMRAALAGAGSCPSPEDLERLATERRAIAGEVAARFRQGLSVAEGVLARLDPQIFAGADELLLRAASAALCAVFGGRTHPPGRESLGRIVAFLRTQRRGRLTAGRVLFDRRGDHLYVLRESRDLPTVMVAPGESVEWDGRFLLHNRTQEQLSIGPHPADRVRAERTFPQAPASLALAALRALPAIAGESGGEGSRTGENLCRQPILQPYRAFLPAFELDLANCFTEQMGLRPFPPLPFNVFDRKRGSAGSVALATPCRNPMLCDK